ncbi:MAG: SEL1-like repeat protein [Burkholderiaceae bacterium]|nr:SEL1-like repeat protein [Burkholderiaceae bacterium]
MAADSGDVGAQCVLASMYEAGLGVPINLSRALQWYVEAARQGDVAAQFKSREISRRISTSAAR